MFVKNKENAVVRFEIEIVMFLLLQESHTYINNRHIDGVVPIQNLTYVILKSFKWYEFWCPNSYTE